MTSPSSAFSSQPMQVLLRQVGGERIDRPLLDVGGVEHALAEDQEALAQRGGLVDPEGVLPLPEQQQVLVGDLGGPS